MEQFRAPYLPGQHSEEISADRYDQLRENVSTGVGMVVTPTEARLLTGTGTFDPSLHTVIYIQSDHTNGYRFYPTGQRVEF